MMTVTFLNDPCCPGATTGAASNELGSFGLSFGLTVTVHEPFFARLTVTSFTRSMTSRSS